jgi:hypothetical protein
MDQSATNALNAHMMLESTSGTAGHRRLEMSSLRISTVQLVLPQHNTACQVLVTLGVIEEEWSSN